LDPASRATLWAVIKRAKRRAAVVLTTHAMEEAEELCERLGVFVDGALRCVGAPRELVARHGGFLVLTLTLADAAPARAAAVAAFVAALSDGAAARTHAAGATLTFHLPTAAASLAHVFAALTRAPPALGIVHWGVANMTLEEVFIKLARDIGARTHE
jgi:ABC-type multidrug transport system ATPase subunit